MRFSTLISLQKSVAAAAFAVACLAAPSSLWATGAVITFDNLPGPIFAPLTSYSEGGFNVTNPGGNIYQATAFFGPSVYADTVGTIQISQGVNNFTFDSFDFGDFEANFPIGYTVTGYQNGGVAFTFSNTYTDAVNNTYYLVTNPYSNVSINLLDITLNGDDWGANATQIALNGGTSEFPPPIRIALPRPVSATPEPSSLALLATGVLGMAGTARKRFYAR